MNGMCVGTSRKRGRWWRVAPLAIACLLCLCARASAAESRIKVSRRARALQPGEVLLLRAESDKPLDRLRAEAFGREFPMFPESSGLRWTGLVGIDLETAAGRYPLRIRGAGPGGEAVYWEEELLVRAKQFPVRRLTVDERFVSPPPEVLTRIREEAEKVRAVFAQVTPRRFWSGPFRAPVPGPVISEFGKRSVYNGQPRSPHAGTDFRAAAGTPVRAPNAGRVALAAELYYSGKTVIVDHGFGLYSYFGHLSAVSVREGAMVAAGDVVGRVGATGLATGPHLHWSVRLAGTRVDPMSLLNLFAPRGPASKR
jgi:murein DD-endopeptidase MepM/ murein hydrolase activator NlpD